MSTEGRAPEPAALACPAWNALGNFCPGFGSVRLDEMLQHPILLQHVTTATWLRPDRSDSACMRASTRAWPLRIGIQAL